MQKNKNRQGLALGAVFAMVASLVVMTSPAQAAADDLVIFPAQGTTAQTTIVHSQSFNIKHAFGGGLRASIADAAQGAESKDIGFTITKPAGVTVSVAVSYSGTVGVADSGPTNSATVVTTASGAAAGLVSATEFEAVFNSSESPELRLSLPDRTSVSAQVSVTIQPFIDMDGSGGYNGGDILGTPMTVTFVPWTFLGASLTLEKPVVGDKGLTSSFAVTANASVNWTQLSGSFAIDISKSGTSFNSKLFSGAELAAGPVAIFDGAGTDGDKGAVQGYSASFTADAATAIASAATYSATVYFGLETLVATGNITATPLGVLGTVMSFSATAANITNGSANEAKARINSAFTLDAYPYTASSTQSVAIASAFTVSAVGSDVDFDADSGVIVNGKTYTSSGSLLAAGFTLPAGTKTVVVSSFGQTQDSSNDFVSFTLTSQAKTSTLKIFFESAAQTVVYLPGSAAGLAGTAKSFAVTAKDQWGVSSVRTDQRIAASVLLGGSTSTTVSAALVNGAATVTVTPTPAARTGSAVVTFTLQTLDQGSQAWIKAGTAEIVTWNVYSYAAGSDKFTSNFVSASASISYLAQGITYSAAVSVGIENSFSTVVVSAPGLMIQNSDELAATASDTLTVQATNQAVNLKFTAMLAGTYTVTYTMGTATTTSEIVVDVAAHDSGATLTFDKASIAAGTTTTITGTLKDVNGNPVMTSGSSNVSVAWMGKGLPFGNATNMETDAAGQLSFYVLVLSGEMGDAAISATYKPAGLAVSTKNISVVHAVAVGKAAASAAADQKITIGTYKGYVAVFTKGYAGQKLSVQVASKWHVRNPIVDLKAGYSLLTVNTGAGYVANVIVYIDGVEVERMTITTK